MFARSRDNDPGDGQDNDRKRAERSVGGYGVVTNLAHAVFLSYASQDAEAAQRICEALRAAGIEVWFDQSELRGGDAWDQSIRKQIKNCALFIPVISKTTHERAEGYFRLEWKLAVDRSHLIAADKAFLVPVVVDDTPDDDERVPERFRELQWTRLPAWQTTTEFVSRIQQLLAGEAHLLPTVAREPPKAAHSAMKPVWLGVFVALVPIATYLFLHNKPTVPVTAFTPPLHSIAVLPFTNLSGDPKQEYFSEGISEELIETLSQINALQVTARTSSFFFKGKDVDLETIAHKLNVATILEGSIRRDGDTVRVTVDLINPVTGFHIWSQKYDRELKGILALQSEIAGTVAEQLRVPLLGTATIRREAGGTQNPQAYDAYLRGRQLYYSAASEAANRSALAEFDRAIALDPNFAAAYGLRAVALMEIRWGSSDMAERDVLRYEANTAAERAVALAPDRADVHTAFWWVRATGYFDFRPAEIERALALAPSAALAHQVAAFQASWSGQHDAAIKAQQVAVSLDPQNLEARIVLVEVLATARRFDEALAAVGDAKLIDPSAQSSRDMTAYIYGLEGRLDLIEQQKLCEQPPRHGCLARIKHLHGDVEGANKELAAFKAKYGDSRAYAYAQIYAQWNDIPLALQWLETAERLHDPNMVHLKVDPLLDPLREEPRFRAIERALKFPGSSL